MSAFELVLAIALATGVGGSPQPPGATVRWEAPSRCPQREDVIARIEAILGKPLRESTVEIVAEGAVRETGSGWSLTLTVESPTGGRTRTLSASECAELGEVAALLVAVAIDPGAGGRLFGESGADSSVTSGDDDGSQDSDATTEPDMEEAETVSAETPAASEDTTRPESSSRESPPTAARSGIWGGLGVAVGLNVGALPSASATLRGSGSLSWKWLRFELGAAHRFARPVGGVVSARVWNTVGQLDVCGMPTLPRIVFPLCVGVEAGTLTGRSEGIAEPRVGRGPWTAMRARAAIIVLPWRRVGLFAGADVLLPLVRTGFEIDGIGEVYRVGAVGLDALGGLEIQLP